MIIPKKLKLAFTPTPLQKLNFEGKNFLVKRDDLTGLELTGNKVRKLEYLIYQAKKEKADYVFTDGGEQSNHARATVIAAAKAGIKSKIFLWGKDQKNAAGNLFIDKFMGAEISFLDRKNYNNVNNIMREERENLLQKGKKVYVIPEGGSTTLGIWGYVSLFDELEGQLNLSKLKGIVSASGSGGTAAGLLVGAALRKLKLKVYAVNVLYSKDEIRKKILQLAEGCILDYKLDCAIDEKNLVVLDGYSDEGYKSITKKKLELIKRFTQSNGIIFDPAYTGKAFTAYYENFILNGRGNSNLFLHTGGIFGVFAKSKEYLDV